MGQDTKPHPRDVFNKAAEEVGIPHRSTLGSAAEAEAALAPKLEKLELYVRRGFDRAGLNFYAAWDFLLVEHLMAQGWNVRCKGESTIITGSPPTIPGVVVP